MKKDIKRIAIVRLSALGDIVNSAVVLQFIHQKYPHVQIEWITEEVFAPLLRSHPLIHAVHSVNLKRLKKERSFRALKETVLLLKSLGKFDLIIDMQGLLKSSIVARLIGKNTHGFDKKSTRESVASLLYRTSSSIPYDTNIVKRNSFVVADALGFTITDTMLLAKENVFPSTRYKHTHKNNLSNIAIVIGASWESKKYPKEKILLLVNELKQNSLIIWGNKDEKKDAQWICDNSEFASLAPRLSLVELVSYISSCDLLIGNDTGPTHMAWAQNIPSITLFGPTNERMIYENPKNIAIHSPSDVNIFKINKQDFTIAEIEVKEITKKATELLHGI